MVLIIFNGGGECYDLLVLLHDQENLEVQLPSVIALLQCKRNYRPLKELMTNWCLRGIVLFFLLGVSLSYANAKKPKDYVVENGIRYAIYKDHAEVASAPEGERYKGNIVIPCHNGWNYACYCNR